MQQLIHHMAMRGVMVIFFASHHLCIEALQRFRHLHKTADHFPHQTYTHALILLDVLLHSTTSHRSASFAPH